jgi:hypothetical protein
MITDSTLSSVGPNDELLADVDSFIENNSLIERPKH